MTIVAKKAGEIGVERTTKVDKAVEGKAIVSQSPSPQSWIEGQRD